MSGTLILSVAPGEIRAALFEADAAVELLVERADRASLVGAIFAGRLQQIVPALPGAFVELGLDRPAFLPGRLTEPEGARLLVQVARDRYAEKPPELSRALALPGRLLVWQPGRPGLRYSRRIDAEGRARLAAMVEPLLRDGEGALLRSRAATADQGSLGAEIETLRRRHAELRLAAAGGPVRRLDAAPNPALALVAGLDEPPDRIIVDDRLAWAALRREAAAAQVEFDPAPGFGERHGLDEAFDQALARSVALPGGGRLTLEATAACLAIDVDLGGNAAGRDGARASQRRVNLAAASEVARQLRLRGIGGAVIVDFVSMDSRTARREVEAALAAALAADPVAVQLHGWTRLGHVELTRRRLRTPLADAMLEPPPARRKTAETVALEALRRVADAAFVPGALSIRLHPGAASLLEGRLAPLVGMAARRAGRPIRIIPDFAIDPETLDIGGEAG